VIHRDLHTLTGAHVLHATADTERAAFERHLADCVPCAQEVRELRDTAARLGLTTAVSPPPHLRGAVLTRIHTERRTRRRRTGPRSPGVVTVAAAVLLAATVSLGVVMVTRQADMLTTVLRTEDARFVHADGITVVVSRAENRGLLLTDLPPPPDGHLYQAWTIDSRDSRYHPAGTLTGNGPTAIELTGIATANRVAITVEPHGGSAQPTTTPIAEVAIR
jgi:anti-sigma-K factor RskA